MTDAPRLAADLQAAVSSFHATYGLPVRSSPTAAPTEWPARLRLLAEEYEEHQAAVAAEDLVQVADSLADMVYVLFGTALSYGIDLPAVLAEVHRSNMSKLDTAGRPVLRDDGKVLKGPHFSAPDLRRVLWPTDRGE